MILSGYVYWHQISSHRLHLLIAGYLIIAYVHDVTKVVAGALDAAQWNFLEKQLQLDVQTKPPQAERPEVAAVAQAVAGLEVAASGRLDHCPDDDDDDDD